MPKFQILSVCSALIVSIAISTSSAQAAERTLRLYNTHTKENLTVVYKKNGRYSQAGLRKLNHFMRDWRRNQPIKMDPQLFDVVWRAYKDVGGRKPIHVVSGFRSPATNNMLRRRGRGVAKNSRHTMGHAMDFFIPGIKLSKLRAAGLRMQAGGVGYYPTSGSPFVHFDVGTVRHWPRMNRKQLVAVFPRGGTIHVPSDGKPLRGYKTAMADYQRRKRTKSLVPDRNHSSTTAIANLKTANEAAPGTITLADAAAEISIPVQFPPRRRPVRRGQQPTSTEPLTSTLVAEAAASAADSAKISTTGQRLANIRTASLPSPAELRSGQHKNPILSAALKRAASKASDPIVQPTERPNLLAAAEVPRNNPRVNHSTIQIAKSASILAYAPTVPRIKPHEALEPLLSAPSKPVRQQIVAQAQALVESPTRMLSIPKSNPRRQLNSIKLAQQLAKTLLVQQLAELQTRKFDPSAKLTAVRVTAAALDKWSSKTSVQRRPAAQLSSPNAAAWSGTISITLHSNSVRFGRASAAALSVDSFNQPSSLRGSGQLAFVRN